MLGHVVENNNEKQTLRQREFGCKLFHHLDDRFVDQISSVTRQDEIKVRPIGLVDQVCCHLCRGQTTLQVCHVTRCRETICVTGEEDGRHTDLVEVVLWRHGATVSGKVDQGSVIIFGESAPISKKLKTKSKVIISFLILSSSCKASFENILANFRTANRTNRRKPFQKYQHRILIFKKG